MLLLAARLTADDHLVLHGESRVRFASLEEGRAALRREDEFTQSLSRFDLQVRLNTNQPVTVADLLQFVSQHVLEWDPADREKLTTVVRSVRERLQTLKLPLPKTIWLVKTDGKDEGNAAYCRGPAIMLPKHLVDKTDGLERLFTHELFHVLSNQNAELRERLYAILGFRGCSEIVLPASLRDRKLTNPDAPTLRHYLTLKIDGQDVYAAPLLFANVDSYDPQRGGSLFKFLTFRLVAVERVADQWRVKENDAGPIFFEPIRQKDGQTERLASFFEQVGENTNYIIHPEEILADNFAHLVLKKTDLKTPRVVDELRQTLAADRDDSHVGLGERDRR